MRTSIVFRFMGATLIASPSSERRTSAPMLRPVSGNLRSDQVQLNVL